MVRKWDMRRGLPGLEPTRAAQLGAFHSLQNIHERLLLLS